MNTTLLLLFVIMLIFIIDNSKKRVYSIKCKRDKKKVRFTENPIVLNKENFYGNFNKNEDYSVDDDYYIDRMGTKGYLVNKLNKSDIYDCTKLREDEKKQEYYYENYDSIINKLEIYNRQFYDKCDSDYDPASLITPNINNDPIKTRLQFNQGVLFSTTDQINRKL
jgi:hypothetical protein